MVDANVHDAATVILLRPAPSDAAGFEVYMVKRPSKSRFMPGAYVFPGGRVESTDASIEAAAIRETKEEADIALQEQDLFLWSRWVTPDVEPRRYDARFFVAKVAQGVQATPDPVETVEGLWTTASDMLLRADAGDAFLAPPTQRCLELLRAYRQVDDVLHDVRDSAVPIIKPVVAQEGEHLFVALPGDPAHPDDSACIPGPTRITLPSGWLELLQARKGVGPSGRTD